MNDIVISGYYGFNNSGDDALLLSIINDFDSKGLRDKIIVLSNNPEQTEKMYKVRSILRTSIKQVYTALLNAELFISGGGTLIQDSTSSKSLYYYLALIKMAKLLKCKTMLYANGIGPVKSVLNRKLTRHILNTVDVISLRDEKSMQELKKMKIGKPKSVVTADPVFLLENKDDTKDIIKMYGIEKDILCISIRKTTGEPVEFSDNLSRAVDYISKTYNLTPVFVMLQPCDEEIVNMVKANMNTEAVVIKKHLSIGEMMSLVSASKLCIGMRLHMLIYAATCGVPLIGVVYDPKVSGFMDYANQRMYVYDNLPFENDLKEFTDKCLENYDDNLKQLQYTRNFLKNKAKENISLAVELYNGVKNGE